MWYFEPPYRYIIIVGVVACVTAVQCWAKQRFFSNSVVELDPTDPEVIAAIAQARSTLPDFWRAFEAPSPDQWEFAVKVRFSADGLNEHLWCEPTRRDGSLVHATVANEPHVVPYELDQLITFDEADITDWGYFDADEFIGGETLKLMRKKVLPLRTRILAKLVEL
jgi:uncharacterized protein YegJ (DUF2314 family)